MLLKPDFSCPGHAHLLSGGDGFHSLEAGRPSLHLNKGKTVTIRNNQIELTRAGAISAIQNAEALALKRLGRKRLRIDTFRIGIRVAVPWRYSHIRWCLNRPAVVALDNFSATLSIIDLKHRQT